MLDYHTGELEVQTRAGVPVRTSSVNKSLRPTLPPIAQTFLHNQRMIVLSTIDSEGRVWASVLTGEPGFLKIPDEQTVEISATPGLCDPLSKNLRVGGAVGMIAIEFATRRRMRVNGQVIKAQGEIVVHTEQVYSNCPKYIQARVLPVENTKEHLSNAAYSPQAVRNAELTSEQRTWIGRADTFFIATSHPEGGADASHRGGYPGFVQVESSTRLAFPDYSGNRMFQTLGNISVEPHTGLLFLDFESGDTLQLTGKARVIWDKERVAAFSGAERLVEFSIDEVIETKRAMPLHWQLVEYSPSLPQLHG